MAALLERLGTLGITTTTVTHPAVFTVEQAKAHRVRHDGTNVKNLFLRNKRGAMWLVVLEEERVVDLRTWDGASTPATSPLAHRAAAALPGCGAGRGDAAGCCQ